jgi:hypothetical protein
MIFVYIVPPRMMQFVNTVSLILINPGGGTLGDRVDPNLPCHRDNAVDTSLLLRPPRISLLHAF